MHRLDMACRPSSASTRRYTGTASRGSIASWKRGARRRCLATAPTVGTGRESDWARHSDLQASTASGPDGPGRESGAALSLSPGSAPPAARTGYASSRKGRSQDHRVRWSAQ